MTECIISAILRDRPLRGARTRKYVRANLQNSRRKYRVKCLRTDSCCHGSDKITTRCRSCSCRDYMEGCLGGWSDQISYKQKIWEQQELLKLVFGQRLQCVDSAEFSCSNVAHLRTGGLGERVDRLLYSQEIMGFPTIISTQFQCTDLNTVIKFAAQPLNLCPHTIHI